MVDTNLIFLVSFHSIMLTKALMKGPTMLQALINLGGMKKVWTAACLVVVAWLGLGLATILAGKELKETMVMVTVTFCSRDLVIGDWLVVTDRIQSRPETSIKVLIVLKGNYITNYINAKQSFQEFSLSVQIWNAKFVLVWSVN